MVGLWSMEKKCQNHKVIFLQWNNFVRNIHLMQLDYVWHLQEIQLKILMSMNQTPIVIF